MAKNFGYLFLANVYDQNLNSTFPTESTFCVRKMPVKFAGEFPLLNKTPEKEATLHTSTLQKCGNIFG